jgi:hypothetical protein
MPILDLGPRRPNKKRVPNSDEQRKVTCELVSILSGYILAVGVTREFEMNNDYMVVLKYSKPKLFLFSPSNLSIPDSVLPQQG